MTKEETLHTLRTMTSVGSLSLGLDSVIALIESLDLVEVITVSDEAKSLVIEQLIEELDNDNMGDSISSTFAYKIMDYVDDFEVSMSYNKTVELDEIILDEYRLKDLINDGVREWLNAKLS